MRSETSFEIEGDLIVIEAMIVGPGGRDTARLVLDTGATLTTLQPAIAELIGYTAAHRVSRSVVRSAVGNEPGYIVRMAQLTALGVTLKDVSVNVSDLGHGIDGLLGMSFLCELNFEVRLSDQRILAEKITP
jgi:clan AA aspartic protease (TIGR02281 family)